MTDLPLARSPYGAVEHIAELTEDNRRLRAALADEQAHADRLADALADLNGWESFAPDDYPAAAERVLADHNKRRTL